MSAGVRRKLWRTTAAVLVMAGLLPAQIKVGENVSLNSSANVAADYDDTWGNQIQSSHGLDFGLNGTLTGSYYSPNFLSFSANPYFNQSRSNSNSESLTNASGVALTTAIFSGSHFPGHVNFNRAYNSQGNFNVPGLPDYTTHGSNQNFAVNWSELVPDYPTLTAGYIRGSNRYSLFGTDQEGSGDFHSTFLDSTYKLSGFNLSGSFRTGASDSTIPRVFEGQQQEQQTNSNSRSFSASVSHLLPWNGGFGTSYNRSYMNSDYAGYKFNGTIDTLVGSASFHPTEKLTFAFGSDYTDNLSGLLYQQTPGQNGQNGNPGTEGQEALVQASSTSSHSWDMSFMTGYSFLPNLQGQAQVQRRQQFYAGQSYSSSNYGGGLNYTRRIAGGSAGGGVFVNGNHVDQTGENTLGLNISANYNRNIEKWSFGTGFTYGQSMQTLLVTELTSFYTFTGNVGRHFLRHLYWNAAGSLFRTGFTVQQGTDSKGESVATSFGVGRVNFGASYAQSRGNSVGSNNGLQAPPLPGTVPGDLLITYGGQGYSFSASGTPVRRMMFTASYSKSRSDTNNQGLTSWNHQEVFAAFGQWQFRQLNINGGYTRLIQGFSASSLPPAHVNSFSIGISRWFDFF